MAMYDQSSQLVHADRRIAALGAEVERLRSDRDSWRECSNEFENAAHVLEAKVEQLEAENKQLVKEHDTAQDAYLRERGLRGVAEAERDQLKAKIERLREEIGDRRQERAELLDEIERLRDELAEVSEYNWESD